MSILICEIYYTLSGNATDPTTDFATGQPQSVYRVDHSIIYKPKKKWLKRKDDRNGRPKLRLTTVFVKGTTTAFVKAYTTQLLQVPPQHLLKPDHKRWERLTTAFVKGTTTVCLKGRPQHYLRSLFFQ